MDNLAMSFGGNFCLSKITLARGSTVSAVSSTGTITYAVDGVFATKAALSNQSVAVSITKPDGTTDNGSFTGSTKTFGTISGSTRVYCIFLDASGNVSVIPGPVVASADLVAGVATLQWAGPQRNKTCAGALRVTATSGTTYTPGTTNLNAAGITDAYYDLLVLPAEPLRS